MFTTAESDASVNPAEPQRVVMECRTPESLLNNPPRLVGLPALKAFATFVATSALPATPASRGDYVF